MARRARRSKRTAAREITGGGPSAPTRVDHTRLSVQDPVPVDAARTAARRVVRVVDDAVQDVDTGILAQTTFGLLVSLEDSLYNTEQRLYGGGRKPVITPSNNNTDQMVVSNPNVVTQTPKNQVVTTIKYTYHKVKSGESLGKIAADYNATIQELMEWNQLDNTRISVGQMLKIQTKVTTTIENPEYIEQQQQLNNPVNESDALQNTQDVKPTIVKPAPKPAPVAKTYYAVRSGDTFSAIASRHGLTITQLKKLNPSINESRISVGQKIRIK